MENFISFFILIICWNTPSSPNKNLAYTQKIGPDPSNDTLKKGKEDLECIRMHGVSKKDTLIRFNPYT